MLSLKNQTTHLWNNDRHEPEKLALAFGLTGADGDVLFSRRSFCIF